MNDPVNLVDPDGKTPEVHVSSNGDRTQVDINIPFTIKGIFAGTRSQQRREASRIAIAISGMSGEYGRYDVTMRGQYIPNPEFGEAVSYFREIRTGSRAHVIGDTANISPDDSMTTIQHETGHLLGLPDRYTDIRNERGDISSVPHPGYEDNLMGTGQRLSEGDITNIIQSPRNNRTDAGSQTRRGSVTYAPARTGTNIRKREEG